jgi:hypothetical protein
MELLEGQVAQLAFRAQKEKPRRGAGVDWALFPLASLRVARHAGVQKCRERVPDRFRDLSPRLGDFTSEERITGVVFSS